jgi:hypothetical protein
MSRRLPINRPPGTDPYPGKARDHMSQGLGHLSWARKKGDKERDVLLGSPAFGYVKSFCLSSNSMRVKGLPAPAKTTFALKSQ